MKSLGFKKKKKKFSLISQDSLMEIVDPQKCSEKGKQYSKAATSMSKSFFLDIFPSAGVISSCPGMK